MSALPLVSDSTPRSDVECLLDSIDGPDVRAATAPEIEQRLGDVAAKVVACGHTHIPRIVRTKDGYPVYHVVENGSAAQQAAAHGRRDREVALTTGYLPEAARTRP